MNYSIRIIKAAAFFMTILVLGSACKKLSRPALGDYPQDANPPGGPLKFYAAFDGTTTNPLMNAVDSIRANFPSTNPLTSVAGISGKAVQGKGLSGPAIKYPSANDFAKSSSFTMAFWEKETGVPQSADGPQFVMSLFDKDYWHNSGIFLLFDHTGAGSTADSAAVTLAVKDNWYVFHNKDRIPKIYDQQWHHMAFVYDASTSTLTTYIDGQALTGLSKDATKLDGLSGPLNLNVANVSNLVIGGWNKHAGLDGPGDDWIKSFPGSLDQFRLYGKALSASEVQALYNSKL